MPHKKFSVYIYDVLLPDGKTRDRPFAEAIDAAINEPLADRYREISGKGRRLDQYEIEDDLYLLNFLSYSYPGPGRAMPDRRQRPNALARNEYFTTETAALYDAYEKIMFLESSFSGMGPGAIARYFREFTSPRTNYQLQPRYDGDAWNRASRFQTIRRVSINMRVGPVTAADRDAGIDPFLSLRQDRGAETVKFEVSAGRSRRSSLDVTWILSNIERFRSGNDNMEAQKIELYGREHDDEPLQPIDLIQHKERRTRNLSVDDVERKVDHGLRWDALRDFWDDFTQ